MSKMDKRVYYKYLWLFGAIWNWLLGIGFILITTLAPSLIPMFGAAIPPSLIWVHSFFALVFIIGFAFFILSLDIDKNHGIAQFGAIDKFAIQFPLFIYFFIGDINILGLFPVLVDLVFAVLYLEFVINYKKL